MYCQCAVAYSDFWAAYAGVIPSKRHRAVGKQTGKTNYIERFNCTLRQRVSRLVRKTLSFSKKIENHIGAIGFFVHHYNSSGVAEWQYELSMMQIVKSSQCKHLKFWTNIFHPLIQQRHSSLPV